MIWVRSVKNMTTKLRTQIQNVTPLIRSPHTSSFEYLASKAHLNYPGVKQISQ